MSDIEIKLKTIVDQGIADLKKAASAITDIDKAADGAQKSSSGWAMTMTGLNQTMQAAKQIAGYVKDAYDAVIGSTIDYIDQVDSLSRSLGVSAEEASTLIQITDDVFISQEALTAGMRSAVSKGIDPSIEGLKELADKYNSITDPIARSKFLIETFGKSGLEMGKLLEQGADGIDSMTIAAQKSGLIMSGSNVNAAKEYKKAVDDLNDSVDSIVYNMGMQLLPILVDILVPIAEFIKLQNEQKASNDEFAAGLAKDAESFDEFKQSLLDNRAAMNMTYMDVQTSTGWLGVYAESFYELNHAQKEATTSTEEIDLATSNYQTAIEGLQTAQENLEKSQQSWLENTATEIEQELSNLGEDSALYEAAIKAIDDTYGTSLANEDAHRDKVQEIVDQYKRTGDIDAFGAALARLRDDEMPSTTDQVEILKKQIIALGLELDRQNGRRVNILVDIKTTGGIPDIGQFNLNVPGLASGGSFVVPPGYENDSFGMAVSSNEKVAVTPAGAMNEQDILLTEIRDLLRSQQRGLTAEDIAMAMRDQFQFLLAGSM